VLKITLKTDLSEKLKAAELVQALIKRTDDLQ